MDRRLFLRSMLGAGAGLALPSTVWPFRKYFLPLFGKPLRIDYSYPDCVNLSAFAHESIDGLYRIADVNNIVALELESFRKEIPDLLMNESTFYEMLKRKDAVVEFQGDEPAAFAANQVLRAVRRDITMVRSGNGSSWMKLKANTQG